MNKVSPSLNASQQLKDFNKRKEETQKNIQDFLNKRSNSSKDSRNESQALCGYSEKNKLLLTQLVPESERGSSQSQAQKANHLRNLIINTENSASTQKSHCPKGSGSKLNNTGNISKAIKQLKVSPRTLFSPQSQIPLKNSEVILGTTAYLARNHQSSSTNQLRLKPNEVNRLMDSPVEMKDLVFLDSFRGKFTRSVQFQPSGLYSFTPQGFEGSQCSPTNKSLKFKKPNENERVKTEVIYTMSPFNKNANEDRFSHLNPNHSFDQPSWAENE